jgi:hypothetical protein
LFESISFIDMLAFGYLRLSLLLPLDVIADQRPRTEPSSRANCGAHTRTVKRTTNACASCSTAERTDSRALFPRRERTAGTACDRASSPW